MQTMNLKIDDTFFPHFKAMIEIFAKDKKIEIVESESTIIVTSVQEVQTRVRAAEQEESMSEEEYQKAIAIRYYQIAR